MDVQTRPATEKQDDHEYSSSREINRSKEEGDWSQNGRAGKTECADCQQAPAFEVLQTILWHGCKNVPHE